MHDNKRTGYDKTVRNPRPRTLKRKNQNNVIVRKHEKRLKTLLPINHRINGLLAITQRFVKKDRWARISSENSIQEKSSVFEIPYTPPLVRRVHVKLAMLSKIKKPANILR